MMRNKSFELLESHKAYTRQRNDEISISVNVTKVEKKYKMIQGQNLNISKIDNQQRNLKKRNVQRLSF